jgi:UDPglucose 6-dehydrogenase
MPLLGAVVRTNDEQPRQMLRLLGKHFSSLAGVKVAVLGLAFKPGTDDMRESPAIPIIRELRARRAVVSAYDPVAGKIAREHLGGIDEVRLCAGLAEALEDAQAVLLVTRWPEFESLPDLLANHPLTPIVVDGRRMIPRGSVTYYEGIGLAGAVRQPLHTPELEYHAR